MQLTPEQTINLIKNHGFAVQKKYGQNFLIDNNILTGIVSYAGITEEDCVIEIGPGMGALTGHLLDAAKKVIAVEVDKVLIPILEDSFSDRDNFVLINDDILKVDLKKLIEEENDGKPVKVVANLPYYITTPIVLQLLELTDCISSITVMVQKEVAQRMMEGPGSKAYGALSLAVQYYSDPHVVLDVSKNCFYPKPDVDSQVIKLDVYDSDKRPVNSENPDRLFKIIRATFGQRRKTMVNSLSNNAELKLPKDNILEALEKMGKSATVRGEVFTLEEFAEFESLLK